MTGTIIAEDEVRGWAGMKFSEVLGIVFQLAGACRSAIENDALRGNPSSRFGAQIGREARDFLGRHEPPLGAESFENFSGGLFRTSGARRDVGCRPVRHLGIDVAGTHGVDGDAASHDLECDRPRQSE